MFDISKIGQSFPSFTIEVEAYKMHEFALAIGDDNPIYHNRAAAQATGYPDIPLFPTAPTIFWFWGNTELVNQLASIGIDFTRVLHSGEEYHYLAPIYPGDTLTGIMKVADGKVLRQGGIPTQIVILEINYTNQHGHHVLKARETLAVR